MVPTLLDTDIGTDIDDALALIMVLGSDRLELVGVTTVYVDTPLRSRIARALLDLADRPDVIVSSGESVPIRPIPARGAFGAWEWHEGRGILYHDVTAEEAEYLEGRRPALRPYQQLPADLQPGVNDLVRLARQYPDLHVICIGPLTNIATALLQAPDFERLVGRLTILGGYFANDDCEPRLEHNFCSDVGAAEIVFRSALPITLLSADVTELSYVDNEKLAPFYALHTPLANTLSEMTRLYLKKKARTHTYAHDPLTVALAEDPELGAFEEVVVHLDPVEGKTRLNLSDNSIAKKVTLVRDVWLKRSQTILYKRLMRVCG
jgi:purine nucleosidase